MFCKGLKYGAIALSGATILGGMIFGRELVSYVGSGARQVRVAIKDNVPVEFELERARDMVDGIIPELRANIQVIAQEEVEIAHLKQEIDGQQQQVDQLQAQMVALRGHLSTRQVSFEVGEQDFSRQEVTERLAHRLQQFRQAESILQSKEQLLAAREKSLQAARKMLERTRARKVELEQQIESLAAQHRLVKAQAVGSKLQLQVDDSQLARADKLLSDLQRRLDVAQRVLAHESDLAFEEPIEPVISEAELMAEVDATLGRHQVSSADHGVAVVK
jgi:chromosome segregation ATPase